MAVRDGVAVLLETAVSGLLKPVIEQPLQQNEAPARQRAAEQAAAAALALLQELFAVAGGGLRHDGLLARRLLCHLLRPLAFDWLLSVRA